MPSDNIIDGIRFVGSDLHKYEDSMEKPMIEDNKSVALTFGQEEPEKPKESGLARFWRK